MSKNERVPLVRVLFALAISLLMMPTAPLSASQYACYDTVGDTAGKNPLDDPCPEADDVRVPLPGGLHMVFRAIPVPGDDFWGNPERNIQLGDPDARMFEGPRMVSVSGSFPSADGQHWEILIGKYEVTVAQLAVVYGDGDIDAGLQALADKSVFGERWLEASQENVSKHVRRRLLAAPARGLSIADLESFVRLYTQWCYKTQACVDALPRFGSLPGFFRLPTEIEWEYTARQHGGSDNRISSLPFEAAKATDFAYLSSATRVRERPTSIGRLQPTHFGVHDLYGNVSELLDGRFLAELGQGKPGMRVSRGGSYAFNAQSQSLRPSTRSEVQDWRLDENGALVPLRNARLGIRLALGSHTVPDIETLDNLEESYVEYRSTDRLDSAAGVSTQATVLNTVEPLKEIDALVQELSRRGILSAADRDNLKRYTNTARTNISETSEALSIELIRRASEMVAESARTQFQIRTTRKLISVLSSSTTKTAINGVKQAERKIIAQESIFDNKIEAYKNTVFRLAGYREFALSNLQLLADQDSSDVLGKAVLLVQNHTIQVMDGKTEVEKWEIDILDTFASDDLFSDK